MRDEQQRLVQRIQTGEAEAEQELFRQYAQPVLWKITRSLKTDAQNLKDIAAEVYLAILQGLRKESFAPEKWDSLEAFIWGVTQNKIRDWFKAKKREHKYFHDDPPSEEIATASEEYLLENEELGRLLRKALRALAPKYKEVLELRYLQELPVHEMGAQLGLPGPRVSERIHYALKCMRAACEKMRLSPSIFGLLALFYLREGMSL